MKVQLLNSVENIVRKGEMAHYEQFLLLQKYFQESSTALNCIIQWKRINLLKPDTGRSQIAF